MRRVLTVIGARPQFIKAAVVSRAFARGGAVQEVLVHTGQHHDPGMSDVFFEELDIPNPNHHLGIAGGGHGDMTGRMLQALEPVVKRERPDGVLVYGDTNSTLAGALVAAKLSLPVLHVEAGLRSRDRHMPEEINRRVVDHLSTTLFCPTARSVVNLAAEGIRAGVHEVGDVMLDSALMFGERARERSTVLHRLGLVARGYVLASCHRAGNVDEPQALRGILAALQQIASLEQVVLPLHPRTRENVRRFGLAHLLARLTVTEPLGFLDMVRLEQEARLIITDSGGVQKEAFFFRVPCITLRAETEWMETVHSGWNALAGNQQASILDAYARAVAPTGEPPRDFGDGDAASRIDRIVAGS